METPREPQDEPVPPVPEPDTDEPRQNWAERLVAPLMWLQSKPAHVDKNDPVNNSGSGGPVPPEIAARHWCWGALGLGPIWSLYNGLWWLAVIQLMPLLSIPVTAYLFYAGYAQAWQNRRFRSHEQFLATMRTWNIAGIIAFPCWVAIQVSIYVNR